MIMIAMIGTHIDEVIAAHIDEVIADIDASHVSCVDEMIDTARIDRMIIDT
jgi:hypothetical protein